MGHTNSTTYYNLPQFLTSDKPAWLTDINNAMSDIDTGLHSAQSDATTAGNNATQALSDASAASTAAAAADAKGAGACASIEASFDSTAVYAVGTKVMYNSLLYRCSVAVTTPGPWTGSANWERITVNSIIPTSAGTLPLGSDFSDPASTASAVNDKAAKTWTLLSSYSGSSTADISTIFSTANEIKVVARTYTTGQLGSSQVYSVIAPIQEINDFLAGGFTELHYLQGMNNGQTNVVDFGINTTAIRLATFILNGNDVQASANTGFKVYYR